MHKLHMFTKIQYEHNLLHLLDVNFKIKKRNALQYFIYYEEVLFYANYFF